VALRALSLCAGIGGIDLGLQLALGGGVRTVAYVEREAAAAAVVVARMEDASLGFAPVWDDIATFDCGPWRGKVDLVTAGFPCQPFSTAGKHRGKADDRWLWPRIGEIVREIRPRFVFLENVPPLVTHGLDAVLGTLAELGFDAEWDVFSAGGPPPQGCEAPHLRKRFFLLAESVPDPGGYEIREESRRRGGSRHGGGSSELGHLVENVGDSDGAGLEGRSLRGPERPDEQATRTGGGAVAGSYGEDRLFLWPPGPNDSEGWREYIDAGGAAPAVRHTALVQREAVVGDQQDRSDDEARIPGNPEPGFRGGAHGPPSRVERLNALGNGVVPVQVALAWTSLASRLGVVI
jgi:DNA (cytosine-5)-methyltransferase 1